MITCAKCGNRFRADDSEWASLCQDCGEDEDAEERAAATTSPETPETVEFRTTKEAMEWAQRNKIPTVVPVQAAGDDEGAVADGRYCRHHDDDPAHGKICYDRAVYEGAK